MLSFFTEAQNVTNFKSGTKATPFFLNNSETTFHSCTFTKMHKIVLVQIWDSNADSANSGLANAYLVYNKYGKQHFKKGSDFELVTIAVGKNLSNWKKVLESFQFTKTQNFISFDGYWDLYLKNYLINKTPFSMLVDETGTIIMVDPTYENIEAWLSKNSIENPTNVISGKVMVGYKTFVPLAHRKIYVTNKSGDTIQTVVTNSVGNFTIKNNYPKNELSISVSKYPEIKGNDMVYLATPKGKIIGEFNKVVNGFIYKFLNKDVQILKLQEETDPNIAVLEFKNKLFYRYYLFHSNETILHDSTRAKIDLVIQALNDNPGYKVEILSHADNAGNTQHNMDLSKARAKVIIEYMLLKGIDKKRIFSTAFGDKMPIIKCDDGNCTPSEMMLNRRTEFKLSRL